MAEEKGQVRDGKRKQRGGGWEVRDGGQSLDRFIVFVRLEWE